MLILIEDDEQIIIDLLELMPTFQGKGIGSAILKDVILKSKKKRKVLSLTVLKNNHRAKQLYERKGFVVTKENDERYFMIFYEEE